MNYWIVAGLALDLAGVLCLGVDLVRLQRALRASAKANRKRYDELEEERDGVESWLDELADQSSWMSVLPKHVGETPESHNARRIFEIVREVSSGSSAVAALVAGVAKVLDDGATQDENLAARSLSFTYAGLSLLVIGFVLQIVGAL